MLKPRFLLVLLALCFALPAWAQNPVKWTATLEPKDIRAGEGGRIVLKAVIQSPWYTYAPSTPAGGPTPTSIELVGGKVLTPAGKLAQPKPLTHFDDGFKMETQTYKDEVSFGIPLKVKAGLKGVQKAIVKVRYQTCNAKLCLPPKTVEVPVSFTIAAGAARPDKLAANTKVPDQAEQKADEKGAADPANDPANDPAVAPVAGSISSSGNGTGPTGGLLSYAILAFGSGLVALLTPCVFPMIPITVSFFTKRAEGKAAGISGPIAFCAGIIGTFTVVGVAVSVLFGAAKFSQFAANPYVNLGLALLFVLMALNLFGAFEIIVPSSILNKVNPQSKGGLIAPLLMGFAFTLTSFTCTVPFVGTALFTAASGGWIYPAIGMLAFSTAFSLPFFLLALFPAWLTKLPRAGEWLITTKAFMGFLELAAALKFLSTADMVWKLGYITRSVFLSFWFAIFAISALYLLGILRLPKDSQNLKIGPLRRSFGVIMVAAPLLMLASMNGASLGDLDGYLPPRNYGKNASGDGKWLVNDLASAKALAKSTKKPLLINFTGYACTNCRVMEANVLPDPVVLRELDKFVPVELYTDGLDAISKDNNKYQQSNFGTIAIPMYAVVEPNGKTVLGRLDGLERNPQKFADFLKESSEKPLVASLG